jgi:hypothetical protein
MNRGAFVAGFSLLSMQAHAHVSHAQGLAHATEHLWLLLAMVPVAILMRPLTRRLLRKFKR